MPLTGDISTIVRSIRITSQISN